MEVLPNVWIDLWNQWDIRIAVLISLLLQILLIMLASWRRRTASKTFALFIWSFYLLADWVAAFALGLLCNSQGSPDCYGNKPMAESNKMMKTASFSGSKHNLGNQYNDKLLAFWAPFLLLHLGGPDTITAFAMEDNELWLRHLLGLLFETGAAVYIFLLSIPKNPLLLPTLLMFLAGTIKYGERTYALYRASLDGFRDSMLNEPDPGPNYAKLMEEYTYKKECGIQAEIKITKEAKNATAQDSSKADDKEAGTSTPNNVKERDDVENLKEAHEFFNKFKGLIVELIFSFHERNESYKAFSKKTAKAAFRVVEFELSFVYEVLFTKAVLIHENTGYFLRAICSCSIIAAFLSFFFLSKNNHFIKLDIAITYTLLGGAICLDAFAFLKIILSDWTIVKLEKQQICKAISDLILKVSPQNRWSVSVTQHNLICYCIPPEKTYYRRVMDRLSSLCEKLDKMLMFIPNELSQMSIAAQLIDEIKYTWREDIMDELKEHIYKQLLIKAQGINDMKETRRMCSCRGDWALEQWGYFKDFGYSVEVEFDESLLMWHIATDLCYYTDENTGEELDHDRGHGKKGDSGHKEEASVSVEASMHRKVCKLLSDYLVYLLVMRPAMMSSSAVIGKIRYRDTCAETKNFFDRRALRETAPKIKRKEKSERMQKIACDHLLSVNTSTKPKEVKGDRSKSVLFDACILAKKLKMEMKVANRWEVMSEVWIEMLTYAACRCPGIAHAQRLSKGGELLTFVWFLMTHLGLGEQFQIEEGHARAKLIVHN